MVIRITKPELSGMAAEARSLLDAEPFVPFRLVLHDGRSYDIAHPRLNLVTNVYMVVGFPEPGDVDPVLCDRTEIVRFDEVAAIAPIPQLTHQEG